MGVRRRPEPLLHALALDWKNQRAECNCPFGWGARWKNFVPPGVGRKEIVAIVKRAHRGHVRQDDPVLQEWRREHPMASWDQFGIDVGLGDEEESARMDLPPESE